MRRYQVIHQRMNLIEIQFGGGVRVKHRGMVNMRGIFVQRRLNRQVLPEPMPGFLHVSTDEKFGPK